YPDRDRGDGKPPSLVRDADQAPRSGRRRGDPAPLSGTLEPLEEAGSEHVQRSGLTRALGFGFTAISASSLLLNLVLRLAGGTAPSSSVVGAGLAALLIGLALLAVPGDD